MNNRTLSSLADVVYGRSPNAVRSSHAGYPMYGTGGVVGYSSVPLFDREAVIVPRKGSLGNPQFAEAGFWAIDTTFVALPKEDVDAKWLYYQLAAFDLTKLNEATGVPSINRDWLLEQRFSTPSLPQQRRIAAILSALDEQIEKTDSQIEKQSSVLVGLEQQYFPLCLDLRTQASTLARVGDFADVLGGKRLPGGHDYSEVATPFKYLRVTDFYAKHFSIEGLLSLQEKTFNCLAHYEIHPGDIYVSIAGSIGYTGVMPHTPGLRVILTENAARIRINSKDVLPAYLSAHLNSQLGQRLISEKIGSGAGVPKLALERIKQISVRVPSIERQSEIANQLSQMQELLESERMVLNKLRLLKQGLMRDLLTGRVRVGMGDAFI